MRKTIRIRRRRRRRGRGVLCSSLTTNIGGGDGGGGAVVPSMLMMMVVDVLETGGKNMRIAFSKTNGKVLLKKCLEILGFVGSTSHTQVQTGYTTKTTCMLRLT